MSVLNGITCAEPTNSAFNKAHCSEGLSGGT